MLRIRVWSFSPSCKVFTIHASALLRSQRKNVQPDNSALAYADPAGPAKDVHPIHAHSQSTLRLTTISLERSRAGCLYCSTAAVGSTILLTCSIAGARAERPGRVKLTSLLSPRRAISEPRAELRMRPSRVSATSDPSRSFEHMIVRRENCVFREIFLPLIPNRVSETAKHIQFTTHSFTTSWGDIPIFGVLIL
jgi:hypothetical protein